MTVASTVSRIIQTGDGVTTEFPVNFYFLSNTDLVVILVDQDNTSVTQSINSQYTVSGAGDETGGSVNMLTAPPSGYTLVIYRDPALTQLTDYQDNDPFPAETHERALDKLTMMAQRARELLNRSMRLPDSDTSGASTTLPTPSATNIIGWNADGSALVNYTPSSLGTTIAAASWKTQKFSGNGVQTQFVLMNDIGTASNCDVSISRVVQIAGDDFTYDATTKTLTFNTAPAVGSGNIAVRYGSAIPAQAIGVADMSNVINTLAIADGGTGANSASSARTNLGIKTAALYDVGVGANNVVQLTSAAKLPALDASLLTNLPTTPTITAASNPAFDNSTTSPASTDWVQGLVAQSVLGGLQVFDSDGTFNVPSGVTKVKVRISGPGGNGGAASNGSGQIQGGGGSGGGYGEGYFTVTPGDSIAVTVGVTSGQTSSFGSLISATSGSNGGNASVASNGANATSVGTSTGGYLSIPGSSTDNLTYSGASFLGPSTRSLTAANAGGNPGLGHGAGGTGGRRNTTGTSPGGAGAPGIVIVEW
jgi:hypothetical protein